MKKVVTVFLLVLIIPFSLMAGDVVQLGVNFGFKPNVSEIAGSEVRNLVDLDNIVFAPEAKLNFSVFSLDAVTKLSFGDNFRADVQGTAGLRFKVLDRLVLGAGIGGEFSFVQHEGGWLVNNQSMDNFKQALKATKMAYKFMIGADLGAVEIIGAYDVPTEGTLQTFIKGNGLSPEFKKGTVSLGVLFNIV